MATYDETVENKTTQEVTVPPKATRRVLSPSYKARILKEYDACPQGGKGELLRREGLFSSQITEWRRVIDQQSAEALSRKRGPKPNPLRARVRELERENERLNAELEKSRKVIAVQRRTLAGRWLNHVPLSGLVVTAVYRAGNVIGGGRKS